MGGEELESRERKGKGDREDVERIMADLSC